MANHTLSVILQHEQPGEPIIEFGYPKPYPPSPQRPDGRDEPSHLLRIGQPEYHYLSAHVSLLLPA